MTNYDKYLSTQPAVVNERHSLIISGRILGTSGMETMGENDISIYRLLESENRTSNAQHSTGFYGIPRPERFGSRLSVL